MIVCLHISCLADHFGKRVFEGCYYWEGAIEVPGYGSPSRWLPGAEIEASIVICIVIFHQF